MGKSISLDIAAIILLIILMCSCVMRKMTRGLINHLYIAIISTSALSAVFDIAAVSLDNAQTTNVVALYGTHFGYLLTHYLSVPLYLIFIIALTDSWHKLCRNYLIQAALISPAAVMLAAFIVNFFDNKVFSVTNGYERGPWFILMYVTTVIYVIYAIVYIICYRKLFLWDKMISLGAIIPITMIAMVIQMLNHSARVEIFGGAVGLLIISIGIQRPEDHIDSFTRLITYSAYVYDMKRTYLNNKHVTVIMLNIGNFPAIQAMIGFDAAMEILNVVADKVRTVDKGMHGHADLYYLDNCRFRMVLSGKNKEKAERIAEALNRVLKRSVNINDLKITLEPFVVLAQCPEELKDFKTLMSFGADFHKKNYYTGKVLKAGEIYDKGQLDIHNNIDAIIDRALKNESFEVYYQPIYSVSERKFISAEALIRLNDPQHGFISPELLITAAEQSGAIHKIGEFVFEQVCGFIASDEFERLGLRYIEVNLSVAQVMNGDLPDIILSIMDRHRISPDKINLEITETAAAYDQRVMTENIDKLVKAGLSFSLDDYGTGYSNMKRVIQLPLEIIKLDKSFVDENDNSKMWIFIKNTVRMLKDMNMKIVVEGVETKEMLDAFSDLECDYIQGYFFSKPIARDAFVEFITNENRG